MVLEDDFYKSARPNKKGFQLKAENLCYQVARPARFEHAAYGLEVRCSIQLSYGRNRKDF